MVETAQSASTGPDGAAARAPLPAQVEAVPYGRPALEALGRAVGAAQGDDRLAPVTVVVPSNTAGLVARRALGRSGGIANVAFVTPFQLAEQLGGAAAAGAGTVPLTTAVLGAAVRAQLVDDPGPFRGVAAHEATEAAVVAAYAELSRARPETLARLETEGGAWAGALVRLFRSVQSRLHRFTDEDGLARAALGALAAGVPPGLGALVVYLPQPSTPALTDLLRGLGARVPVRVVIGVTGEPAADAAVLDVCTRIGWPVPATALEPPRAPALEIVETADPDEEVRAVVRGIVELARQGVPLDRVAVLHPRSDPYARIAHEQLVAAGIPHHGPSVRTLADSAAGRTLLRLLELSPSELQRHDVVRLVAGAPVRDAEGEVPAPRWDTLSRRAGVLGGADDWAAKLAAYRAAITARREQLAESVGDEPDPTAGAGVDHAAVLDAMQHEEHEAERLAAFVGALADRLDAGATGATWVDAAGWATTALEALLGPVEEGRGWPEPERQAYEEVQRALDRIATLDGIDRPPDPDRLRRAVERELAVTTGRAGRFGHGVLTGPLALGIGLAAEAVFVLGLVEGVCPAPRQEDSLLPDAARALAVEGELGSRADALAGQRRELLAALAAAAGRRVVLTSRGDPRTGRASTPSRWLLDAVGAQVGHPVSTRDFATAELTGVRRVASFVAGVRAGPAAVVVERDLAALDAFAGGTGRVVAHPLVAADPALAAGLDAQHARAGSGFTRWDGNLSGARVPSPATGRPFSPTRLESWVACPFRYFLGQVLRLDRVERPEEILEISALDRGSLVHEILERFVGEQTALPRAERIRPAEAWSPEARARLHVIADECAAGYVARGLTGRSLMWELRKAEVHDDLDVFLAMDEAQRAALRSVPEAVEMTFGSGGHEPVQIALPGGRTLAFRGQADRVDLTAAGAPVVVDYKTGNPAPYRAVAVDPVDRGFHLQLPLYAAAAAQRAGVPAAAAYYWFPTVRGDREPLGYVLDDARRARFVAVLEEIVDGIEGGVFPLEPEAEAYPTGFENCRYCEFDRLCPSDRLVQADAKREASELVRFRTLRDTEFDIEEDA
jgi:RecB family exonuclease